MKKKKIIKVFLSALSATALECSLTLSVNATAGYAYSMG